MRNGTLTVVVSMFASWGQLVWAGGLFVVEAQRSPGVVRELVTDSFLQERHTHSAGAITAIAFSRKPTLALIAADGKSIIYADGHNEVPIYTQGVRMRDIEFDDKSDLYFSEAAGARGNGKIMRLGFKENSYQLRELRSFYEVRLADIDGYWDGHFTVHPRTAELYLCTGTRVPASIYAIARRDGFGAGPPRKVFTSSEHPICSLAFDNRAQLYYVDDHNSVYKLQDGRSQSYKILPRVERVADLAFLPELPRAGSCTVVGRAWGPRNLWSSYTVTINGPNLEWITYAATRFGSDGRYLLQNLPCGSYFVSVDSKSADSPIVVTPRVQYVNTSVGEAGSADFRFDGRRSPAPPGATHC